MLFLFFFFLKKNEIYNAELTFVSGFMMLLVKDLLNL